MLMRPPEQLKPALHSTVYLYVSATSGRRTGIENSEFKHIQHSVQEMTRPAQPKPSLQMSPDPLAHYMHDQRQQ